MTWAAMIFGWALVAVLAAILLLAALVAAYAVFWG